MVTFAACVIVLAGILGVVLTVLTLPGTWFALVSAALVTFLWQKGLVEHPTLIACGVIALLAEVVEFFASAAGSAKAGGTKRGAALAIVGGLVGAIAGAAFPPVLGAILWGAVGAGVGAIVGEKLWAGRSWEASVKSGQGAAIGKFVATILKTGFAGLIALLLAIAAFNPLPWTLPSP